VASLNAQTPGNSDIRDAQQATLAQREKQARSGAIHFEYQPIAFQLETDETPERHAPETMAGGVAIFDYNNDGKLDIFFTNGADIQTLRKSYPEYSNRLFENDGNGHFKDVTEKAGLAGTGYDIGVAIGSGKGLVVPVLRNAERMSFAEIEVAIGDFGRRAKENKLKVEELQGGTFTISNGGVYGSLLSTPIVNPPQSGVLGMHAIQERPVARDGNVVIRSMMYVALTYDHRVVDGREAVSCLKRIKETIEGPARMLMEV